MTDRAPADTTRRLRLGEPTHPAHRSLRITVIEGADAKQGSAVFRTAAIVGRANGVDVQLADPTVSSFHCELSSSASGVRVVDLGSRNGTVHAGAIIERATVPPGSVIRVGDTLLRIELDAPITTATHDHTEFGELRGSGDRMRELFATLERLCPTDLATLIEGETGTGKELAARAIHARGPRAGRPFVVLDCTSIPQTLAESMLFGHEKGAFTGAADRRIGVFEAADGGTLFLDEIGELPLDVQPKLLRALDRREIVCVGDSKPRPVDVRTICATWRNVRAMINEGRFREDLYYRLVQARVALPPLRDRPEDVPLLVRHFLERMPQATRCARAISDDAMNALVRREYPGNVRELKSVVERAAMMAAGPVIEPADIVFERMLSGERERAANVFVGDESSGPSVAPRAGALNRFKDEKQTVVDEFERRYLQRLLERTDNNLSRAAGIAGINRNHLRRLFRKHGLSSEDA